jgi:hypothetical protein
VTCFFQELLGAFRTWRKIDRGTPMFHDPPGTVNLAIAASRADLVSLEVRSSFLVDNNIKFWIRAILTQLYL